MKRLTDEELEKLWEDSESDAVGQPGITDYRNPNLAAIMKTYGFIQRFGRGIQVAENEMKRNGNPPPEFLVDSSRVVVVLRKNIKRCP